MSSLPDIACRECGYEGPAKGTRVFAYALFLIISLVAALVLFVVFPPVVIVFLILALVMGGLIFISRGKYVCRECGSKAVDIRDKAA